MSEYIDNDRCGTATWEIEAIVPGDLSWQTYRMMNRLTNPDAVLFDFRKMLEQSYGRYAIHHYKIRRITRIS